ncbi:MAG: fluoride efflux transporter CrcB [Spirochaetaceae bacterium]|jgi:CrcB protein|nr:fluoride efflux transporter CrcB [Spirochaetaceae bacterium]
MDFLFVAAGGAIGAGLRYAAVLCVNAHIKTEFPLAVFAVNVAGAFAIGFAANVFAAHAALHQHRLFIVTGLLGGWTTFSTYALETVQLFQKGAAGLAVAYVIASNLLCFLFVLAGMFLSRLILSK